MRRWIFLVVICVAFPSAHAEEHHFLFWYPGEAGSTPQAQPLLDQFAERLDAQTPGMTWKAIYFSTESAGRAFLTARRPSFGIVSYAMYMKYRQRFGMAPIAATRPLPEGKTTEVLALYAGPCAAVTGGAAVYCSQPWPLELLRTTFSQNDRVQSWRTGQLRVISNMRQTLEQMTQGAPCALAILSGAEQAALGALKAPWVNQLTLVARSTPLPTPPVVAFRAFGSQPHEALVREALLTMSKDPAAGALLNEMRLAGFSPP